MQSYFIKKLLAVAFCGMVLLTGCKKQDEFLDKKRENSDVTPSTLTDYQALLDNNSNMNYGFPIYPLVGMDNYYVLPTVYNAAYNVEQDAYTWAADIWQGTTSTEWTDLYRMVEIANIVLEGIQPLGGGSDSSGAYSNIKGSALFYRSFAFYNVAGEFCKPYTASTAAADPGIPIRQNPDINVQSTRATVQQTYDQITADLEKAIDLLPTTPLVTSRPSKISANALLAKVYLSMEKYDSALFYANKALALKSDLLDFNNTSLVKPALSIPFPTKPDANPEMLFYGECLGSDFVWGRGTGIVDSNLYNSYDVNDLRRTVFFQLVNGSPQFRATYDGYNGTYNFAGIANNEIYLIRAECNARKGETSDAVQDVNALLANRYVTGTFTNITASDADSALRLVLKERRKELPFTGIVRWEDLRRLNKDPRFAVTLTRNIGGTIYTLAPNDENYVLPIPDQEVQLAGMQQNPRH